MVVGLNFIALPNEQGSGAFHYIRNLLSVMSEYTLHDTHFIVYKQRQIHAAYIGMPANANVEYVDVPTLGNGWKRIVFEQTLFYRYIKACDVFYSYCTSMPLLVHAKRVFTLHDVYYLSNPERYGWLQRTYLKAITRLYAKRAHEILTVSKYSMKQIETFIPESRNKIRLTYNILPAHAIEEQKTDIPDKPYFLFVGSIQPSKNIIRMVDAFEQFNTDGKYQLIIVGKPLHAAETILSHLFGKPDVCYLGYRSDKEIAWLYRHTQAVVLVSLCEGFGIPPLEGFLYGKPALVANATSLPEVVGDAGIKVNPLDINDIAKGFQQVIDRKDELVQHTHKQIELFDKNTACEIWMNSLHINYTK